MMQAWADFVDRVEHGEKSGNVFPINRKVETISAA